jgi:antitoxin ParD1/3/4
MTGRSLKVADQPPYASRFQSCRLSVSLAQPLMTGHSVLAQASTVSVELGAQRASLERHLESGHYGDASEVIRDALRALDQRDAVFDDVLRAQVMASMKNKRPLVAADEVFKRLEARHARRTRAARRGA